MNNHRFPHDVCVNPDCYNWRWAERGIRLCGSCAKEILRALKPEVAEMAEQRSRTAHDSRISQLETLVRIKQQRIDHLEAERNNKQPRASVGIVYYLRVGGYIKIGWTSDLTKRMRAYPPDTILLATEPGTRKDEHRRHRQFAAHRTHGREWYALAPALTQHIDRVAAEHGKPERVDFAAKPVTIPMPRPKQYVGGNYRGGGAR